MKLMWKQTSRTPVVESVQDQTTQAEHLARIAGQDRLADPRTNPAVRAHADRLRDMQHRRALESEHSRALRRHRVDDRRSEHAEKALEAIHEAREVASPAKSVRVLHSRRSLYMGVSLLTSVALAGGSAMGLEQVASEYKHIPAGSGIIAEVGLTGLATLVILARSDLAQHDSSPSSKDWRNWALWALMVVPLAASMAANIHGGNFLGAVCAGGAAAFSLFSYIVGVLFADAAAAQARKVTGDKESELREIAIGDDLFALPSGHADGDHPEPMPKPMATYDLGHKPVTTSTPHPVTTDVPTGEQKTSDHTAPVTTAEHKPMTTPVATPEHNAEPTQTVATPESMATVPAVTTAKPTTTAAPVKKPAKRRTRDEIRTELQKALKDHYEDGGGEPQVKPLAERINVNRRIVRELLDEMNVRPMIRKAV